MKSVTDVALGLLSRCSVSSDAGGTALVSCGAIPLIISALEGAVTLAASDSASAPTGDEAVDSEASTAASALAFTDSG